MGVCPAMHFVILRGTELTLGMGVGDSPEFYEHNSKVTPSKVKCHPEVKLL